MELVQGSAATLIVATWRYKMKRAFLAAPLGLLVASAASAQDTPAPFTGARVGMSIGQQGSVDRDVPPGPNIEVKRKSLIVRGTAGYDVAIGDLAIIGAEINIANGGRAITSRNVGGTYRTDPKLAADLSGRVGIVPATGLLLFGKAGWAMQRITTVQVAGNKMVSTKATEHGLLWGAGAEVAVSPRNAVRVEFDKANFNPHYSRTRLMGGMTFRF